jgi:hypothetical protein
MGRRAMGDVLPGGRHLDPRHDDFGFLELRVLTHMGGADRLLRCAPGRRGWLRADAIGELYRMRQGGATKYLRPLCTATAVNFWLRALDDNQSGWSARDHGRHAFHAST